MHTFHPPLLNPNLSVTYDASDLDTNLAATTVSTLGVTQAAVWDVYVLSSVILGASTTSLWGLDFNGMPAGSIVRLIVQGRIQGAGGAGGDAASSTSQNFASGGGGGGQGSSPGAAGQGGVEVGGDTTSEGTAGTTEAAGVGGVWDTGPMSRDYLTDDGVTQHGEDGGAALRTLNIETYIINYGEIFGGGGGGGAGGLSAGDLERWDGGDGGTAGQPGSDSEQTLGPPPGGNAPIRIVSGTGGAAGEAVQGNNVTFLQGGSSPNVEGAVTTWP